MNGASLLPRNNRHEWRAAGAATYSDRRGFGRNGVVLLLSDRGLPGQDAGEK